MIRPLLFEGRKNVKSCKISNLLSFIFNKLVLLMYVRKIETTEQLLSTTTKRNNKTALEKDNIPLKNSNRI